MAASDVMRYSAIPAANAAPSNLLSKGPSLLSTLAPWISPAAMGVGLVGGAVNAFLGADAQEEQIKEQKRQARFAELMRLREMNLQEQQYRESAGMRGFQTANQAFPAINASQDWRERLMRMRS